MPRLCCDNTRTISRSLSWGRWRLVHCFAMFSPQITVYNPSSLWIEQEIESLTLPDQFSRIHEANRSRKRWALRSGSEHVLYGFLLQVPDSLSPMAFIAVQIKGPTQHFIKREPMRVTKVESLVFVQTDKPIYKPGQTGIRNSTSKTTVGVGLGWGCCSFWLSCGW